MSVENKEKLFRVSLAGLDKGLAAAETEFAERRILQRIWRKDSSVWSADPAEISNRLGWLDSPGNSMAAAAAIIDFVAAVKADGFTRALLLGMGGSSLAAEVFSRSFGAQPGFLDLEVLDSTHPDAVLEQARKCDPQKTLYIISTKSGGTVETFSLMKFFYNQALAVVGREKAGRHFVAITDPGSGLESAARELDFRKIFLNDPNIGGRYAALSLFGIVPAALLGIDIKKILERAAAMADDCQAGDHPDHDSQTPARLGMIMGQLAADGRDKITFITSERMSSFANWLEQLIAESTGKGGKGILPVVGEAVVPPKDYGPDRLFVNLRWLDDHAQDHAVQELRAAGLPVVEILCRDAYDIGGEYFRWEMATAIACWRLGIQPFNQPDVEAAKVLAREMLAEFYRQGELPRPAAQFELPGIKVYAADHAGDLNEAWRTLLGKNAGDFRKKGNSYISIQAYAQADENARQALQQIRSILQRRYAAAVTVGYGPRFLHSTGQLHKGDGGRGIFIQILSRADEDAPIPDQAGADRSRVSFGTLIAAQAFGDRQALLEKNRRVITFQFTVGPKAGFAALAQFLADK